MVDNIPPWDLHGEANDSDGDEKLDFDHILYDDISPAQDIHRLDDFDMSEDEKFIIFLKITYLLNSES